MNVARFRYAPDDPRLADFVNNLEHINGLGERSEGFVWRLKDDNGNAMAIHAFDDPRTIVNVSVWTSIEALQLFAYRCEHVEFFRRRLEWFEAPPGPSLALWWLPAGATPTGDEARARLEHLADHGPSLHTYTFKERFPAPLQYVT